MSGKRILVVDDDPHIQELVFVNLAAAGFEVDRASDGQEAMAKLQSFSPDLIVLDVMMPEMDGWEFCKLLKDDAALADVRVVMLTARDSDRDRMIGKGIFRVDEYITKPFEVGALVDRVRALLHGKGN